MGHPSSPAFPMTLSKPSLCKSALEFSAAACLHFRSPADLLEEADEPQPLTPYCTISSAESVNAVTGYPFFNLQDPSSALVLSSVRDHPIRLNSALTGHLGASYPVVNPMTEEFICPHSLLFSGAADRFIAGSDSLISVFDVSRPGEGPIASVPTGPKRKGTDYSSATTMRGIVSALGADPSTGVLAAGTFNRYVGLYDSWGQGDCVGVFSVKGTSADEEIGGGGITQISWSPCGRYLYIAERKSDGVMCYDIRKTGQLLSWLRGRNTQTNQRLGIDVVATEEHGGHEVWAGGIDGQFRMWKNPHQQEGSIAPAFGFEAHGGRFFCCCTYTVIVLISSADAVSSSVVHHGGGVIATSSGQRHPTAAPEGDDQPHVDFSLKIWKLG